MSENKQLYEKQSNQYNPFFPIVRLEDIIETISDKSIQWILNNYNHIYVEYSESVTITRNKVPSLLRRTGLWISYNTGKEVVTEYYNGDNKDVLNYNIWTDDANWERFDKIKHLDGSIEYRHLSEALKQLIGEGNNITNFPDEEDITTDGTVLSFKDRNYEPANFSGLGRVILRKNIKVVDGQSKNILTQDMINKHNTIYEIRYDFDLGGAEITIPEGCVLDFQGGSLSNGTIEGNNTSIRSFPNKIFDLSLFLNGTFTNEYIDIRWFGAVSDLDYENKIGTDVSPYIVKAIECTNKNNGMYIKIVGRYYLSTPIITPAFVHLIGESYENNFTMSRGNNPEFVYNNPPSMIYVKRGITAFTLIGTGNTDYTYPKATSFTLKNIRFEGEVCNKDFAEKDQYDSNFETILLTHTATGNPSRFCSVYGCNFSGFDKVFNIIPADKFYKWGTLIGNFKIDMCFFTKSNNYGLYIDGYTNYEGAFDSRIDTVTGLFVINTSFMCTLHLNDLYGPNSFNCVLFEGRRHQISCSVRDASIVFNQCYFEYQALPCDNIFNSYRGNGVYSFIDCYNTSNNTNTKFHFYDCRLNSYTFAGILPNIDLGGNMDVSNIPTNSIFIAESSHLNKCRFNNLSPKVFDSSKIIVLGFKEANGLYGNQLSYSDYSLIYTVTSSYNPIFTFYKEEGAMYFKCGETIYTIPYSAGYYFIKIDIDNTDNNIYIKSSCRFVSNIGINFDYPETIRLLKYNIYIPNCISIYKSDIPANLPTSYINYYLDNDKLSILWNGKNHINMDGTNNDKVIICNNLSRLKQIPDNTIVIITDDIDCKGEIIHIGTDCSLEFKGGKITNGTLHATRLRFTNGIILSKHTNCTLDISYAKGQCLYDEELNKPIWWTGDKWVDATGADV